MDMKNTSALPEANQLDHATRESIKAMAGLIAVLQQREQSLEDLVRQQLQLLQSAVNNADQRVNRVVENALPRLTQLTNQALTQALEPAVERFNKKMVDADQTLHHATYRYTQAQQSLENNSHATRVDRIRCDDRWGDHVRGRGWLRCQRRNADSGRSQTASCRDRLSGSCDPRQPRCLRRRQAMRRVREERAAIR